FLHASATCLFFRSLVHTAAHCALPSSPTRRSSDLVTSALRAATHVMIPIGPYPVEYVQLPKLADALHDVAPLRETSPTVGVLMVRVRAGTAGYASQREAMSRGGWKVLSAHVPLWERYGESYRAWMT